MKKMNMIFSTQRDDALKKFDGLIIDKQLLETDLYEKVLCVFLSHKAY